MLKAWSKYRRCIQQSRVPALLQIFIWVILGASLLRIWRGNPNTVQAVNANTGSFLLEALYFAGLYMGLCSYSRTLSVRQAIQWFYVGLVGVTTAFAILHTWIYSMGAGTSYHPMFGSWGDKNGFYHMCIFSPLLSEGLKTLPIIFFLWMAKRKGTQHTYAISDWAIIGFLIGIGFHVAENAIHLQHTMYGFDLAWPSSSLDMVLPIWRSTNTFQLFDRSFTVVGGSHGVQSGLIGMALGAALFFRRRGAPGAVWFLPLLTFLLTITDHALFNLGSLTQSPLLEQGWVRTLYIITAGGRVELYLFGFGMFALAAVELWLVHRRWNPRYPAMLLRQVVLGLRLLFATITGTAVAIRRTARYPIKWLLPIRVLFSTLAGLWLGVEVLLQYLNSQWAQARVRHAVAWSRLATPMTTQEGK